MSQLPAPSERPPQPAIDPALLASLLAQAQAQPPSSAPATPAARPNQRQRRVTSHLLDSLTYAGAGCFGLAGWMLGGFFTLTALTALGLPIVASISWPWALSSAALASWSIPLIISLIEVRFWPNGASGWRAWFFWGIALIDVASTIYGLRVALADRPIPLGAGFTLAQGSTALWLTACVLALILTFAPEQIVTRSLAGLREVWS